MIGALASLPLVAAATMSGACAASCPYGLVNDPYPGHCPRYSDLNGDGICDFSQTVTTTTATDTSTPSTSDQTGHGHGAVSDSGSPDQYDNSNASLTDPGTGVDGDHLHGGDANYYILPVSLILISAYLFTHYLFEKGILRRDQHRRIWNLLLMGGYLGTGVTGMLLILMINMGIKTALNPTIIFWHVELAILMVIGTLIHIHLYRKPFKMMFKVLFGFKSSYKKRSVQAPGRSK